MSQITILGRFTFNDKEVHKDGGQGEVFLGHDLDLDKNVAVKRIYLNDLLARNSFRKEIEALGRLRHPNVVKIIDSTIIDHQGYLVLPWMRQNLLEYLEEQIEWSNAWALDRVIIPLADALSYMHERGQAHRDISGRNVMMELRKPIFIDFASSAIVDQREDDKTVGPAFSRGYTPDNFGTIFEKDVYSFGVLALEAYTRKRLQNRNQIEQALAGLKSQAARKVISKCIQLDPAERYPDAMQMKPEWDQIKSEILATQQERRYLGEIVLTNSAREGLKTWNKSEKTLESSLTSHLKASLIYWYPASDENGQDSTSKFWLIADGVRFLLVPSGDNCGWTAVTAINSDSEDLEKYRRKGKDITYYKMPWNIVKYFTPTSISRAGFEFISNRFQEWIETGKPNSEFELERRDAREYLSKLLRTIEAKEDVAKGRKDPIYFTESNNLGHRVTLKLAELPDYPLEGTFWRLASKGSFVGEVDYQSGLEINLILRKLFKGKFPSTGKLIPDIAVGSVSAYKRQRDAIESIISGSARGSKIGDFLANPSEVPRNYSNYPTTWFIQDLDEPKKEAVSHTLGSNSITLIQGPPGTGKTTYISELIAQTLSKNVNSRILLVSQTHVALDNALERLLKLNVEGVVRLGNPDSDRISDLSRELLLDKKMQRWVNSLELKSNEFAERYAQNSGFTLEEARLVLKLSRARQNLREMKVLNEIEVANSDWHEENEDRTATLSQIIDLPVTDTVDEQQSHALINLEKRIYEIDNPYLTKKFKEGNLTDSNLEEMLIKLLDGRIIDDKFKQILLAQSEWLSRVGSSEQLSQLFLKTCKVLAGTCLGFLGNPAVRTLDFDLCILDEASRATLTESLVPMSKSAKWVIVGDGKQLGAFDGETKDSSQILEEYDLNKNDLHETFFSRFEENLSDENKRFLSIQYRMNDQIGNLISDCFYEGKLESHGPDKLIELSENGFEPVTWFDTSEFSANLREESRPLGASSIINKSESKIIVSKIREIETLVEKGELTSLSRPHILVVTPYAHQVELIKMDLGETLNSKRLNIEIQTIDSVQGREADLVFYSPVRSNPKGNVGFLGEENFQRTNVALSRGRYMTAVVGDCSFWRNINSPLSGVLRKIDEGYGLVRSAQNA